MKNEKLLECFDLNGASWYVVVVLGTWYLCMWNVGMWNVVACGTLCRYVEKVPVTRRTIVVISRTCILPLEMHLFFRCVDCQLNLNITLRQKNVDIRRNVREDITWRRW